MPKYEAKFERVKSSPESETVWQTDMRAIVSRRNFVQGNLYGFDGALSFKPK